MNQVGLSGLLTRRLIILISCVLFSFSLSKHQGENLKNVIWSDAEGYFLYLPAVIINGGFKELKCKSGCTIPNPDSGLAHTKYTYGVALMELPFFMCAHIVALSTNFEDDGFSEPYALAILIAALFYFLAALIMLRKFLSNRFSSWTVNLILLSISFGTNAYYYATLGAGMSHVYSFFLFTSLILLMDKWANRQSIGLTLTLSLVSALILLIRPTGLIALLWIPFSGISSMDDFKNRIANIFSSHLASMAVILTAILYFPQFYYWRMFSGEWFTYSYGGEGFSNWANPEILNVLFSHQNGLFMYSPILFFAVAGLYPMMNSRKGDSILIMVIFSLATYAFASWWAWWFGGAYGHRAYVEYFAFLAIPMAYAFEKIRQQNLILKLSTVMCIAVLQFANVRMVNNYVPPWDGPDWTWSNYLDVWYWAF